MIHSQFISSSSPEREASFVRGCQTVERSLFFVIFFDARYVPEFFGLQNGTGNPFE